MMNDFPSRVEIKNKIAQWKIDRSYHQLSSSVEFTKYSDVFKIGNCEWQLCLCKRSSDASFLIGLDPVVDKEDPSPLMFYTITVACSGGVHETIIQGGDSIYLALPGGKIRENDTHMFKMFQRDNVMWRMRHSFIGEFTVIVQFSGLKTTNPWAERCNKKRRIMKESDKQCHLASLDRMVSENISDVTINTSDGVKIGAHRAILASRSPVFHSMFSHDLQEQENSIINITDMSTKSCQVFFKYIYGNMEPKELLEHRLELVRAADKYDVPQLKKACEESFVEDIDRKNVVEMLQIADTYRLPKLKSTCMEFLLKSGNIFEIQDEFNELLQSGDRDLVVEIFGEILKELKYSRA